MSKIQGPLAALGGLFPDAPAGGIWVPSDDAAIKYWLDPNDTASWTMSGGRVTTAPNKGAIVGSFTGSQVAGDHRVDLVANAYGTRSAVRGRPADSAKLTLAGQDLAANVLSFVALVKWSTLGGAGSYQNLIAWNESFGAGYAVVSAGGDSQDWKSNAIDGYDLLAFGAGFGAGFGPRKIAAANASVRDTTNFHLIRVDIGTAGQLIRIDGAEVGAYRVGVTGTVASATADLLCLGSDGSDYANADCIDWILAVNPGAGVMDKAEGYVAWENGWQANLSAGHPYKAARP